MMAYRPLFFVLAAVVYVEMNVCAAVPVNSKPSIMANQNVNMSTAIAKETFCVGRFLIDVPAGSALTGGNYKYDFIEISPVKAAASESVEIEVAGHELALKTDKNERTKQSMLLQSVQLGRDAKILASWKADFSTALVNIDGYRWIDGRRFQFQLDVGNGKQESGIKRMREALTRLRSRADNDIPIEPGYCFAGGFIANPEWENEEAGVDFRIAGHPDTIISVWFYPCPYT